MFKHPLVATRDCEHCKVWFYNEKTGKVDTKRGIEMTRKKIGTPAPCEIKLQGCAKGHWKNPKTLSPRNVMAYIHYQTCKSVGVFPDDGIVRDNARVISLVEKSMERSDEIGMVSLMMGGGNVRSNL